jgi:hypothetical protein
MEQENRNLIHLINFPVSKSVNSGWRHPGGNLIPQEKIVIRTKQATNKKLKEVRLASNECQIEFKIENYWG